MLWQAADTAAGVQAKQTLRRQELEDRFLTAEEAQRLATHCVRTLGAALARLHTPSLLSSSSAGAGDSPASEPWVELPEHSDKFAAQQGQAAAVQQCASLVVRHVPLVLEALAEGIMLQVRAHACASASPQSGHMREQLPTGLNTHAGADGSCGAGARCDE